MGFVSMRIPCLRHVITLNAPRIDSVNWIMSWMYNQSFNGIVVLCLDCDKLSQS